MDKCKFLNTKGLSTIVINEDYLKAFEKSDTTPEELMNNYNSDTILLEHESKKTTLLIKVSEEEYQSLAKGSKLNCVSKIGYLFLNKYIEKYKDVNQKYVIVTGKVKCTEFYASKDSIFPMGSCCIKQNKLMRVEHKLDSYEELVKFNEQYGILYDPITRRMNHDTSCRPNRKDHYMKQIELCKKIDSTIPHDNAIYNFYNSELYDSRYRVFVEIYNHKNKHTDTILSVQSNSCLNALREMYKQACDRIWI